MIDKISPIHSGCKVELFALQFQWESSPEHSSTQAAASVGLTLDLLRQFFQGKETRMEMYAFKITRVSALYQSNDLKADLSCYKISSIEEA